MRQRSPVDPIPASTIDDATENTGQVGSGLVWSQNALPAVVGGVFAVVLVIATVFVWKKQRKRQV
jgi:hypothetical protein